MNTGTPYTGIVNRSFVVDSSTTQRNVSVEEHGRCSDGCGDTIYKKQLKKFFQDAPQLRNEVKASSLTLR